MAIKLLYYVTGEVLTYEFTNGLLIFYIERSVAGSYLEPTQEQVQGLVSLVIPNDYVQA
jgi:hypothetical protein